jgi:hypothetical protein
MLDGGRTIYNVYILGQDIHLRDEFVVNSEVAALLLGGLDGVELIETIYLHVFEGYLAALVATYQFVIYT